MARKRVLKSLAISKLVYNTPVPTFPPKFTAMVNQAITKLFWNKKAKKKARRAKFLNNQFNEVLKVV